MGDIVVGIDGSATSRNALDTALRLGQRTNRTVRVVHVWSTPAPLSVGLGTGYLYDPVSVTTTARQGALDLLDKEVAAGLARLGADRPITVLAEAVDAPIGCGLVDAAEDAACLVVGTKARGRVLGMLGSTVPYVLHHASCPVLVVPEDAPVVRAFHRVVVGIDGSQSSRSALRWAADIAHRDGAELVAVHAEGHAQVVAQVEGGWDAEVVTCLQDIPGRRVPVRVIKHRSAADALLAEVRGGDLLVVGSRGKGPVVGLVIGSVSARCVARSLVPVAVVRAHGERLDGVHDDPLLTTSRSTS